MSSRAIRTAVVTISDRCSRGEPADASGPRLAGILGRWGWKPERLDLLPDDEAAIAHRLADLADAGFDLVVTTGGTGLGPRDRTPEATAKIADRLVPGIPEWIRRRTGEIQPRAFLSRGVAAIRGRCLLLNLPGSPAGAAECLEVARALLPHALEVLSETEASPAPHAAPEPASADRGDPPTDPRP